MFVNGHSEGSLAGGFARCTRVDILVYARQPCLTPRQHMARGRAKHTDERQTRDQPVNEASNRREVEREGSMRSCCY